jgi:hypothetical protein
MSVAEIEGLLRLFNFVIPKSRPRAGTHRPGDQPSDA